MNTASVCDEWDDIVQYAKKYIDLVRKSYAHVWWKLYNCPDTSKWPNILGLVKLLFTIPLSNGHLEQCFSQLKVNKCDRRSCLKEDHLDNLLRIKIEGPPLKEWESEQAVKLLWEAKMRRVNRSETSTSTSSCMVVHAPQASTQSATGTAATTEKFTWTLDDWDTWLETDQLICFND